MPHAGADAVPASRLPIARGSTHPQGWPPEGSSDCPRARVDASYVGADPRCCGGRSRHMVMRRGSHGTDDDKMNDHRAWRFVDAHIDPSVSD
ncbi:hypothetical protein BHE74_00048426 [Ensete ventricosum]|nr:hypothetical protein GW17_00042744 [Ensete ventricosum]RWW45709.1 hypothetical protein BHE74_00048426 [Ensete ventricosum]RZS14244.1 hypothetical protein BHM03_00045907 [Ensete ventricosum]